MSKAQTDHNTERTPEEEQKADIELFETLAERYAEREEGYAFELAAQSLKEER